MGLTSAPWAPRAPAPSIRLRARQLTRGADRGDPSIRWCPRGAHKGGRDSEREACGQFHDRGHWAPGGREEGGRAPWFHSPVAGLWPSPGTDRDSPGPGFSPAPGPAAPWPCRCPCSADPPSYPRAAECKSLATNLGSALGTGRPGSHMALPGVSSPRALGATLLPPLPAPPLPPRPGARERIRDGRNYRHWCVLRLHARTWDGHHPGIIVFNPQITREVTVTPLCS